MTIASLSHFPFLVMESTGAALLHSLNRSPQAILIEISSLEMLREFKSACAELPPGKLANKIHVIVPKAFVNECAELFVEPQFGHFVTLRGTIGAKDAGHYCKIIMNVEENGLHGIRGLLGTKADIQVIELVESVQKALLTELMQVFLVDLGWSESISNLICTAFDELLMNAALDAPGRSLREGRGMSPKLTLSDVEVHVGVLDEYFGVSVIDKCGTLKISDVWKSAGKAFSASELKVNENQDVGAGIGLSMILRSSGSLCFWSEPGKKTEVSAIFRKQRTVREMKSNLQYISTFQFRKPNQDPTI